MGRERKESILKKNTKTVPHNDRLNAFFYYSEIKAAWTSTTKTESTKVLVRYYLPLTNIYKTCHNSENLLLYLSLKLDMPFGKPGDRRPAHCGLYDEVIELVLQLRLMV